MLRDYIDDGALSGLISLVSRGDEPRVEVLGKTSFDGPEMRRDSLFRVSSLTKPIVAAAALTLVEDLRLSMVTPVADVLPELANPVVLRDPDGPLEDTVPAERPITL